MTTYETAFITDDTFFDQVSLVDFGPWVEGGLVLESPESRQRLINLVRRSGLMKHLIEIVPTPASADELALVHDREYVERIRAMSEAEGGEAGEFAAFGPGTYPIAALAAGAVRDGLAWVLAQPRRHAYALVRPPGHHAERDRGRGYCIFTNTAVAIRSLQAQGHVNRVAIVDIDVHHGNGTEQAFWSDPSVLAISLHQDRCYPEDSGFPTDAGDGAGAGSTINIPLLPGGGVGAYLDAMHRIVFPAIRSFSPEVIVIAVGYDAGGMDPLGRMFLSAQGYGTLVAGLCELADQVCEGRVLVAQEGGYSPIHVPFCGLRTVEALAGVDMGVPDPFDWIDADPAQDLTAFQREHLDEVIDQLRKSGVHL